MDEDEGEDEDEGGEEVFGGGSTSGKWQDRFFILSGGSLRYYSAAVVRSTEPKGVLDLLPSVSALSINNPMGRTNPLAAARASPSLSGGGGGGGIGSSTAAASISLISHHLGRPHAFHLRLPDGKDLEASATESAECASWIEAMRGVMRARKDAERKDAKNKQRQRMSNHHEDNSAASRASVSILSMANTDAERAEAHLHRQRLLQSKNNLGFF